jgi:VTC domain
MIDSLDAVSLDDVLGAAALLTRYDLKYVVPIDSLADIIERLALPVLQVDGRRTFGYESIYFDTADWLTYRASAHGRRNRLKVRTRTYVDSGLCKLELKSKGYRERTVKERIDYDMNDRTVLNVDAHAFLAARAAALPGGELHAALTTTYRRSTLVDLAIGYRVTIDTDLACQDSSGRRAGIPGFAIMETKSANGSCPTDRVLWGTGFRPESVSKYAVGVAALHPDLPRNKWHRVLHRYVRSL